MPLFTYTGLSASGQRVSGEMDAADRKSLVRRLNAESIRPLQIRSAGDSPGTPAVVENADYFQREAKEEKTSKRSFPRLIPKSKSRLSLGFLQNLLVLLRSGMPLGDTLRLLSIRLSDPTQKELATDLWKSLSEGRTLAGAMSRKTDLFDESTVHLVEAGEASGNLAPILERIVAYMEEASELRRNMASNLAYPAFISFVAFGVVTFFLLFLLPRIQNMLETLGGELQFFAKLLIGGSEFLVTGGPVIAGLVFVAILAVQRWRKTTKGRQLTDAWVLRVPIIGNIFLYSSIFQTSSLMATLLDSGVNTTETLRLVERTIGNTRLRAKFAAARRQIQEGVSMASAIKRVNYMPDLAMDILTVGENTGNIAGSLRDINRIYRRELTTRLNFLTTAVSTGALLFAFSLVAIIALSIVLSVFQISSSLTTG
jgi:type II secretory pathway component PulF